MKTIKDAVIELGGKLPRSTEYCEYVVIGSDIYYRVREGSATRVGPVYEFEACAKSLGYISGYRYGVEYPTNGKRPDLPDDVLVEVQHSGSVWMLNNDSVSTWTWGALTSFKIIDQRYKPVDEVSEISEIKPDAAFEITDAHWENAPVWAVDIRNRFGKLHYTDGDRHCKEIDGASWCKLYSVAEHPVVSVRPVSEIQEIKTGESLVSGTQESKSKAESASEGLPKVVPKFLIGDMPFAGTLTVEPAPRDRSWHERGAFPPVGVECDVLHIGEWHETKIVGVDNGLPVFKTDWYDRYAYACGSDFKFRPIRTEREKVIEAAIDAAIEGDGVPVSLVPHINQILERIYDAGMLVLPPKKEGE